MPTFNDVAVVGMHFRGQEAKTTAANLIPPVSLQLEREKDNAYDEYAVKVNYGDMHLGYIEAQVAAFLAPHMDRGTEFTCTVERLEERRKNVHPICTIAELA